MFLTLFLAIQHLYVQKRQRSFGRECKVLRDQDIVQLSQESDMGRFLAVIRSALVDHDPVDGIAYFTRYPVESIGVHDGFRRAVLVRILRQRLPQMSLLEAAEAVLILRHLLDAKEYGYTRVLSWEALGVAGRCHASLVGHLLAETKGFLRGNIADLCGVFVFFEQTLTLGWHREIQEILRQEESRVRYRLERAFFHYCRESFLGQDSRRNALTFRMDGYWHYLEEGLRVFHLSQPTGASVFICSEKEVAKDFIRGMGKYLRIIGFLYQEIFLNG